MTKKTKAPDPVALAQLAVEAKRAEIKAAEARVLELRSELAAAQHAVKAAQDAEDAALPQCRMVTLLWRGGVATDQLPLAILRKTPGNQIVTRRRGVERRFKWDQHLERYVQIEKPRFFMDDRRELRDVPAEFLPESAIHGKEGA